MKYLSKYDYFGYKIFCIDNNWIVYEDKTSHITLVSAMLHIDYKFLNKTKC
jgi:hypothetical protein